MALMKRIKLRKKLIVYTLIGIILIGAGSIFYLGLLGKTVIDVETADVKKGEFIIDVVVPGELRAQQSKIIEVPRNLQGSLQVIWLVSEGQRVEAGDALVKFDISSFQDQMTQNIDNIATKMTELDELITKQATDSANRAMQLEIAELSFKQSELTFLSAQFESENRRRQMEITMKKANLSLVNTKQSLATQEKNAVKALERKLNEIEQVKDKMTEIQNQIDQSTLYAPIPGLVVYTKSTQGGSEEKVKRGDTVFRGRQLMELPDLTGMKVVTSINEVDVSIVKPRQEVIITLDANKDIVIYGTVSFIASIGRRASTSTGNTIKVFDVEIAVENPDESLRPGMTATSQIITDRIEDVVYVPRQSVIEANGETFVYVKDSGSYKKTTVVVAQKNKDFIVIKEGLTPGELVALRDPYAALKEIGKEVKEKPAGGTTAPSGAQPQQQIRQEAMGGGVQRRG